MTSWLDQCSSPCAFNENLLYQPSPTLNQLLFLCLDNFVFLMYSSSFVVGGCEYFFLLGRWGWLDRIWIQQLQCIYSLGSVGICFHSVIPLGTNSKPFNGWPPLELLEMLEHSRARTFNLVLGCFNVPLLFFTDHMQHERFHCFCGFFILLVNHPFCCLCIQLIYFANWNVSIFHLYQVEWYFKTDFLCSL